MQKGIFHIIAILVALGLFGSSSCTLLIPVLDGSREENSIENPTNVLSYEGWHEPRSKKYKIRVFLQNELVYHGQLIGKDIYESEDESIAFILLSNEDRIHKVPVAEIITTEVYPRGKVKLSPRGFFIGLAIDATLVYLFAKNYTLF